MNFFNLGSGRGSHVYMLPPVRARAPCANGVHPCAHGCTRARTVMRDVPVRARAHTVRARVTSIVTVRARVDGQLPVRAQTSTHMRRCVLHAVRARFVQTVITVRARGRCFTPVRERGPTMAMPVRSLVALACVFASVIVPRPTPRPAAAMQPSFAFQGSGAWPADSPTSLEIDESPFAHG